MTIHRDLVNIDTDMIQEISRLLENWCPGEAYRYENHFFEWIPASSATSATGQGWILTIIDTDTDGGATQAIEDVAGGVLALTVDDNALDSVNLQQNAECFKLASDKPLYFEARFAVNCTAIANPTVVVGLCIKDTTLAGGMTDGAYFIMDNGDANLDFVTEKNSTEEKNDIGTDLVDNTFVTVGFFWDGRDTITPYVDGVAGTAHSTTIPDDEELAISFAQLNGEAAANVLRLDYVKVVQKR